MAFNMMINGPGGAPEIDFAVSSEECQVFEGTQLKNCPKIGLVSLAPLAASQSTNSF
jgi:hypothetical protein